MIKEKVVIEKDRIYLENDPFKVVMDIISKNLMEEYSTIVCKNKGRVLDVGFGLGYSANSIYSKVGNYTCIEGNPQIYQKALDWAADKNNVNILFGDWVNVIPLLNEKFDGIFMDTYLDDNYRKFEEFSKPIANKGCILSVYSYFDIREESELFSKYVPIALDERKNYYKNIEEGHTINWTVFDGKKFNGPQPFSLI